LEDGHHGLICGAAITNIIKETCVVLD